MKDAGEAVKEMDGQTFQSERMVVQFAGRKTDAPRNRGP